MTAYEAPGERVAVGDTVLHAVVRGTGAPTVVFEPALGAFGLQWHMIQSQIASLTTTVAYDRAGQGWSDPSAAPRTPQRLVWELNELLHGLGVSLPCVLVAHSFGGLVARCYARAYPQNVAGLVLVDTSHEQQYERLKGFETTLKRTLWLLDILAAASRIPAVGRAVARHGLAAARPHVPGDVWEKLVYAASRPGHHRTVKQEFASYTHYFGASSEVPRHLGDLPLTVVTAGDSLLHQRGVGGFTPQQLNEAHQAWQRDLAQMSTRSRHIVVPGATHLSILFQPDAVRMVTTAVSDMVAQVQAG